MDNGIYHGGMYDTIYGALGLPLTYFSKYPLTIRNKNGESPIMGKHYQVQVTVQSVNVDVSGNVVGAPHVIHTHQVNDTELGAVIDMAVAAVNRLSTDSNL